MKRIKSALHEFLLFGLKEARACVFAGSFFVLLFLSNYVHIDGLARYDFLFIGAMALQLVLYLTGVETRDEVKTIFLFHIIGLCLEIFKTHPSVGSWSYPEEGVFKIGTVPLYSGFMYAAVGSYIAQAWKILRLELVGFRHYGWSVVLCAAIYVNFFTNHFFYDIRYIIIPIIFAFFWKTRALFTVTEKRRSISLNLSFVLIAFFIWVAENISTFLGAWKYPDQTHAWNVVSTQKVTSWFLMVIISFIIVAFLKHVKEGRSAE